MNKQTNPDRQTLVQFMLRAQYLARQEVRTDKGSAMLIASIVTILLFSLLGAFLTMTNLNKSATNAYIDGNNTFYAAESGLNRRASQVREKFEGYATPAGISPGSTTSVTAANIASCFPVSTTTSVTSNDFECRNYSFRYNNNAATAQNSDGNIVISDVDDNSNSANYTAFTFVADKTVCATTSTTSPCEPETQQIPAGQAYAGLYAQDYKYNVYATAAKINSLGTPASSSEAKTVLQMSFKSRIVPLFQFAAFYEDDLEIDSQMPMTVSGPVHTNSSIYAMSSGFNNKIGSVDGWTGSPLTFSATDLFAGTRLLGKVTAAGNIYDRVPFSTWRPDICSSGGQDAAHQTKNCGPMAVYIGSSATPSLDTDPTHYAYFPDFLSTTRTTPLTSTELSVFNSKMLDGAHGVKRLNPPRPGFLREKNYKTAEKGVYYGKADLRLKMFPSRAMPFNFTSIESGGSGCAAAMDIPASRQGATTRICNVLTKGQLQSLQQPVLVTTAEPSTLKDQKILKALRVAIAAASDLVMFSDLTSTTKQISTITGLNNSFTTVLTALVSDGTLSDSEKTTLLGKTPTQIISAADRGTSSSTFYPAPIQLVTGTSVSTDNNVNGGFFNQLLHSGDMSGSPTSLNGTWMTMLQVNIKSLTYWNRYGSYVDAADEILTTPYLPVSPTTLTLALLKSTNNLAFIHSNTVGSGVTDSFEYQGLNATDRTEGGLVFHATVDDATSTATVVSGNTAPAAEQIPGKDNNGNTIDYVDNYRKYAGNIKKSPYGFVISGGEELPGPLTIATDRAAYIQGDYNNPGVTPPTPSQTIPNDAYFPSNISTNDTGYRRQPAAIMADTITVLSNQCSNNNQQVNCGSDREIGSQAVILSPTAINAAFLSNLQKSNSTTYNGGLNKFIRLQENWGGSTGGRYFNYTGSMVSLGQPLESDEVPTGSGIPRRNFNYDSNFNSFEKLPPLTPSAIYLQQEVFQRIYN